MRFLAKFFRRWYLYLLPLLLLPALATIYGKRAMSLYETSALIYINKPSALGDTTSSFSQYLSPAQNGANAMNEALLSETFVVSVARGTDLASIYNLDTQFGQDQATARVRAEVTIAATAVGQNTVTVTVDDKNPRLAQQLAAQLINQFLAYFSQGQRTYDLKQIAFYKQQIQDTQANVQQDQTRIREYLQANPNLLPADTRTDSRLAALQQQLASDNSQLEGLNTQLNAVELDMAAAQSGITDIFKELDEPRLPLTPTLRM
ncbi:MAG: hypothetical protein IVW57_18010, partial [Ktedonobacterales bacterium]|nr:hypothetical protein [Ktedonobacterales bacterium]